MQILALYYYTMQKIKIRMNAYDTLWAEEREKQCEKVVFLYRYIEYLLLSES